MIYSYIKIYYLKVKKKNDQSITINECNEIVDYKYDSFYNYATYENQKVDMYKKIYKHQNDIWCPSLDTKYNHTSKINSWFSILESKPQNVPFINGKCQI